ncbi:MAG: chemotaxis response regulator protein-glutamate methylesterase [Actinomycetota bacterium]
MSAPAKILLVDDSIVIRGMLSRFIDAESDLEVVSTAANGSIGVQKVDKYRPDLVVLDVEMPVMTGLEALKAIRQNHPTLPIIMFSTLTGRGATTTLDALSAGASDYALKPTASGATSDALNQVRDELITKIRALVGARRSRATARPATRSTPSASHAPVSYAQRSSQRASVDAVVIGSSTGGPAALERVLHDIERPLDVPAFIVQHMPENFTRALAERLDRKTVHRVVEAEPGMTAEPGTFYVAAGGRHLRLRKRSVSVVLEVYDAPPINSCRPSVDPLFSSAAEIYGRHALTVMLTGMGADGTDGTRRLADAGADVLAQDEATSTVWGMPRSVVEAGLATEILPLDAIGPRIASLVMSRGDQRRTAVTSGAAR